MRPVLSYVPAGLVAGFVTVYAGGFPLGLVTSLMETAVAAPTSTTSPPVSRIERAKKSDRLPAPILSSRQRPEIATMEVIGGHRTSVIYRDRTGRVLFESDPTRNRTIVAKGVKVPEMKLTQPRRNTQMIVMSVSQTRKQGMPAHLAISRPRSPITIGNHKESVCTM